LVLFKPFAEEQELSLRSPLTSRLHRFVQDELQEVKPSLYRELNLLKEILESGGGSDRPLRQAQDNLQRPWHFARYSLLLMAFSVVPFVGPVVAFFGQVRRLPPEPLVSVLSSLCL